MPDLPRLTTELTRTVRIVLNDGPGSDDSGRNGYGGKPAMRGLGRYYEVRVGCVGDPDPRSGYLINIKDIDAAVRGEAVPLLRAGGVPAKVIREVAERLAVALAPVRVGRAALQLTPTHTYEAEVNMNGAAQTRVILRQRFDFAAAHRLHVADWSDSENRSAFGKCNNASGHGHNYRVEVAVAVEASESDGSELSVLERIVDEAVIERFDHTHLNVDTEEFGPGGLNPSVEHIARVSYGLLERALRAGAPALELVSVTVWETDRTCCTYPAAASA